ncbi:hypothetical protein EPICR_30114 [Candidatus Desulfarcum epimagneticum]|uniref:Tetratricopeptide repeat protein n=1 Tax=uncultured Desulfobacteraceae bacterium TaxID=218296 RepID=A0A484HLN1_9BACT|nr:hypothetical protein EPICR_30114 [uncultured Desulfobacteraceae bacterium]
MKPLKKYCLFPALIIAVFCAWFFLNPGKEEKEPVRSSSTLEESASGTPGLKDGPKTSRNPAPGDMLAKLQASDIPEHVKTEIAGRLEEGPVFENDPRDMDTAGKRNENREEEKADSLEIARLTQDYDVPESMWDGVLESFSTIRDMGDAREIAYKTSKLMDMGTHMLLSRKWEKAEEAFRAVVGMESYGIEDEAARWARAGLIQSLSEQGRDDEAMDEKDIAAERYDADKKFISFLKSL